MGRKLPGTPRSKVRAALRNLWLRSRERVATLKRDGYSCQACGVKQSKAKGREVAIEVHHITPCDWEALIDMVYGRLLVNPDGLQVLCLKCHDKVHGKGET